jgi:hypothetical protein
MNRAILVLLLLIANAIVSSSKVETPPSARPDYSLGRFAVLDGAALPERDRIDGDDVATPLCRRDSLSLQATRETATERRSYNCAGEDARAPFDVRL